MEIVNGGSGLSLSYNGVTEFVAYNSIKSISPLQLRGDFYIVLHFTTEIVDSLKINLAKVTNQPTWTNEVVEKKLTETDYRKKERERAYLGFSIQMQQTFGIEEGDLELLS